MNKARRLKLNKLRAITIKRDRILREENYGRKRALLQEYRFGDYYLAYSRFGGWREGYIRLNTGHDFISGSIMDDIHDLTSQLFRFYWNKIQEEKKK